MSDQGGYRAARAAKNTNTNTQTNTNTNFNTNKGMNMKIIIDVNMNMNINHQIHYWAMQQLPNVMIITNYEFADYMMTMIIS